LQTDVRDLQLNIRDHLAQEPGQPTFSDKKGEIRAPDVGPRTSGLGPPG
jgi:hypothetical protein